MMARLIRFLAIPLLAIGSIFAPIAAPAQVAPSVYGGGQPLGPVAIVTNRVIMTLGQSNAQRMQINAKSEVETALNAADPSPAYVFLNAAADGSFLMQANAVAANASSTNYWLNTDGTPGPNLVAALSTIATAKAAGQRIDGFYFNQGEAEAYWIGTSTANANAWVAGWLSVFDTVRAAAGNNPRIFWVPMNRRGDGTAASQIGYEKLRQLGVSVTNTYSDRLTLMPEMRDQDTDGGAHTTPAGYKALAPRMVRKMLSVFGVIGATCVDGPKITAAARNAATITATIAHDCGTDITPTAGIQGFTYYIDGVAQTLGTGTRVDATHVSWTLPANVAQGASEMLASGYGSLPEVTDYTKMLRDNQAVPLPVRWSETIATVTGAAAGGGTPPASAFVADPGFDNAAATTAIIANSGVTVANGKLQVRQASATFWTARIKGQAELASGTATKQLLAGHRYRVTATSTAPADGTTYSGNWSFVADPLNANIASGSKIQADAFATSAGTLVAYLPSQTGTLSADMYVGFNQRGSSLAANIDLDNVVIEDVTP